MITLKTLPQTTAQEVFNQVAKGGDFNGMTKPGWFIYKQSKRGFLKNTDYIAGSKFETVN